MARYLKNSRKLMALAAVAMAPLASGSAVAQTAPDPIAKIEAADRAADEAAVRALAMAVLDMYKKEDMSMQAIAEKIYTPDDVAPPIVVDIGKTMKGGLWSTSKAEWLEQIKKYIEMPGRPSDFTFALEDPKFIVDDHLATMVALVPTAFRNSKGKLINVATRYTFVFLKVRGEWTLWHEHWSVPATPESVGL